MKMLTFLLSILISSPAFAAIVNGSVSIGGDSNQRRNSDTSFQVWGSFLGNPSLASDSTQVYDSCVEYDGTTKTISDFVGCNRRAVTPGTRLQITFRDDAQFTGSRTIRAVGTATSSGVTPDIPLQGTTSVSQGQTITALIFWRDICEALGGTIGTAPVGGYDICTGGSQSTTISVGLVTEGGTQISSAVTLQVSIFTPAENIGVYDGTPGTNPIAGSDGISDRSACEGSINGNPTGAGNLTNFSGLCDFAVSPGDNKLKVVSGDTKVNAIQFNDGSGVVSDSGKSAPIKGIAFFTSRESFARALPGSGKQANIEFTVPGDITSSESSIIETSDVVNDQPVFVRAAVVDMAGNITHLTSDAQINSKASCGAAGALATSASHPIDTNLIFYLGDPSVPTPSCPYASAPSMVSGLLSDDINCFVATALRGSAYDYQVMALRQFRDRFLKTNYLGQSFVDFYYTHGPKAAQWLNDNSQFKPAFRVILWPAYFIAQLFNMLGVLWGLVLVLTLLVTVGLGSRRVMSLFNN